MEEWKTVNEFGNYEISNMGNVRNVARKSLLKPHKRKDGYLTVKLCRKDFSKTSPIHRLVALHFVENANPTKYNIIDHIDRNSQNNHATNLRWCNRSQNCQNWLGRNEGITKRAGNVWEVAVKYENTSMYLGRYNDEEKAKQIYRCVKDALSSTFSPYKS